MKNVLKWALGACLALGSVATTGCGGSISACHAKCDKDYPDDAEKNANCSAACDAVKEPGWGHEQPEGTGGTAPQEDPKADPKPDPVTSPAPTSCAPSDPVPPPRR